MKKLLHSKICITIVQKELIYLRYFYMDIIPGNVSMDIYEKKYMHVSYISTAA